MPTNAELQKANRDLRAQIRNLEAQIHDMSCVRMETRVEPSEPDELDEPDEPDEPDTPTVSNEESGAPDNESSLKDAVTALITSQKTMMEMMSSCETRKQKVYVA